MFDGKVIIVLGIAFEIANYFNIFDMNDSPNQLEFSKEDSKNNTKIDDFDELIKKGEEISHFDECNLVEELIKNLKEPEIPSEIPLESPSEKPLEKPLKGYLNDSSISSDDIGGYELLDQLIELIKTLFS